MAKQNKPLAQVFHFSLQGKRDDKYEFLNQNSIATIPWTELDYKEPYYFFVPKDFAEKNEYEKGYKIENLFLNNNTGIQTKRDGLVYQFNKVGIKGVIEDFIELTNNAIQKKYNLPEDGRDWTIDSAKNDLLKKDGIITEVSYHPFDNRITYFTGRSKGFMAYPRSPLSNQCLKDNFSLIFVRNSRNDRITNFFISNKIVDKDGISPLDNCKFFPLYLYPETNAQQTIDQTIDQTTERTPNLNREIVDKIADSLGIPTMLPNGEAPFGGLGAIDILDYIYAVLHSPTYREKYKEFLKIDFPRVPYPKNKETFWQLVKLGGEIRQIHLLESPTVEKYITQYPIDGDNVVDKPRVETSHAASVRVYINETQYFDNLPEVAWNFFIGGYQPAQKWLKDRKGRTLEFEDILHYQKIIVALTETDRLMKEIDKIEIE